MRVSLGLIMLGLLAHGAAQADDPRTPRTPHTPHTPRSLALADAGHGSRQPETDRLVGILRTALVHGTVRERVELLRGLAALRDPALKPLFAQLADSSWPEVRLQAILASAELEPERGIDLLAVQRLGNKREQAELIAAAVGLDLLAPGQLEDLARWQDLDPRLTVSIAGLLTTSGAPPAPQRVRIILDDEKLDDELRLHAALVLMQQGDHTVQAAAMGLLERVLKTPGREGDEAVSGVLARVRRQKLAASLPLLLMARGSLSDRPLLRFETLATMLAVAPDEPAVISAAREELEFKGEEPVSRTARRLRVALAMLEPVVSSPKSIRADFVDLLKGDQDPMISAIQAVIAAAAEGKQLGEAAAQLTRQRHLGVLAWTLRLAKQRTWQEATTIRLAVIEQAQSSTNPAVTASAVQAASEVFDSDPSPLVSRMDKALKTGEANLAWVILAGALRSVNPEALRVLRAEGDPAAARAWPDAACAAMADLVAARHAGGGTDAVAVRITPDRLDRIAQGDGDLAMPYRLQAAWLAIKAQGQERAALAKLMSEGTATVTPAPPVP